jgi:hypothetical protein
LGVTKLFNKLKNRFKYGEIMDACERIGLRYCFAAQDPSAGVFRSVENGLLNIPRVQAGLDAELALATEYGVPSGLTTDAKLAPAQALLARSVVEIERQLRIARRAVPKIVSRLTGLVSQLNNKANPKQGYGFLGWLVASQSDHLLADWPDDTGDVEIVKKRAADFPHHPYRLGDEAAVLKTVAAESVAEAEREVAPAVPFWQEPSWPLVFGLFLSIGLLVAAGIWAYAHWFRLG